MTVNNLEQFAYLNIEKYKVWQSTQDSQDVATPPRNIRVIKDNPKSEFVMIQWGIGYICFVPRSTIYYANKHAQAIAHKLQEHAGKSKNFESVIRYLSYDGNRYNLGWADCEPFVIGAVLSIGMFLNVPQDVLMSDELLPAIAAILREEYDNG